MNQQRAGREQNFFGQPGVNRADTARNHDGLVVAPALAGNGLLVFPEIAVQIGPAKFVVESCTTQRTFRHDLQRTGDVFGLAEIAVKQL